MVSAYAAVMPWMISTVVCRSRTRVAIATFRKKRIDNDDEGSGGPVTPSSYDALVAELNSLLPKKKKLTEC
jgi:hypothetical protein